MENKEKFTASSVNHQSNPGVDLKKIFQKRARYNSEYTCTHCFKTFTSAQSFGGHQNAHRAERKEERRLHVKNRNSFRKQKFLRSLPPQEVTSVPVLPPTQPQVHDQGPSKVIHAGNSQNMHGNQTRPKSLSSFDLNLSAIGSNDEIDVGESSSGEKYKDKNISNAENTNTSKENIDCTDTVSCQPLDLSLKL
ncbi:C2H2-type domain-containing protein [Heracleum sosnowskyi]|uniref:C2H2-type domain-containing protein n=1 Tax=Heracleum sosnowskyi TaxID=360622 RepID=A0AAD8IPX3_9APIA|nr:C2H2-type domain-containing protein [Heracleum sosnowskyi]